jgi:gliding motility-associated-like protein
LQPSGASSYEWQTSPTLSCSKCNTPLALPDATTTYYVTGTDAFGCKAEDSITVSVIQPTHLTVPVTSDTLCLGTSVQLNVTGAEQYNWQPTTGLSSTTIGNPVASPVTTTSYTVIGSDSRKCFADTAQISILVAPLPTFNIVDSAVTLNVGSAYTIKTENSPNVIGWAWLPPYGLSCANCGAPVASPKADVTYTAQAITAFGCVAADNIAFKVICNNANIFIPNTFSPNNDSKNDYFYPQGTGLFTIKSLRIFNRWGVLIFAKTNLGANIASNGWDGKYNGVDQQPDVYVYIMDVLCENGSVLSYKGNVTLIR